MEDNAEHAKDLLT